MHHTHDKEVIEKASLISFETNINALQESDASGKSIVAPHPDHSRQMGNSCWGGIVFLF